MIEYLDYRSIIFDELRETYVKTLNRLLFWAGDFELWFYYGGPTSEYFQKV